MLVPWEPTGQPMAMGWATLHIQGMVATQLMAGHSTAPSSVQVAAESPMEAGEAVFSGVAVVFGDGGSLNRPMAIVEDGESSNGGDS